MFQAGTVFDVHSQAAFTALVSCKIDKFQTTAIDRYERYRRKASTDATTYLASVDIMIVKK